MGERAVAFAFPTMDTRQLTKTDSFVPGKGGSGEGVGRPNPGDGTNPGKSLLRDPCKCYERGGTGTKGHKRPGSRGSGTARTNAAGWHTQCLLWSQLTCYAKESCLITTT
jgi:hypothetical protein